MSNFRWYVLLGITCGLGFYGLMYWYYDFWNSSGESTGGFIELILLDFLAEGFGTFQWWAFLITFLFGAGITLQYYGRHNRY